MAGAPSSSTKSRKISLTAVAPGLAKLLAYKRYDLPHDLRAGLAVAAVALPVGVAYAQLAGFNPAVGLYSSILPLVAYAIFGTSRQLIVGPDAATCALVAAAVTPLAAGDQALYTSISVTLAFLAGTLCIGASFLKLGAIADFLSKPILVGFLNGIALSIVLGQLGKLFGFPIAAGGIVPRLMEFVQKIGFTHWPTVVLSAAVLAVLFTSPRILPQIPAPLIAMILSALAARVLGLESRGISTVGAVPAGLPSLRLPHFSLEVLPSVLGDAAGLALVTFSSMMLTSRSFASKNRYEVDSDQEFAALGASNIASSLFQGFAVSGADSRTAMNDASGGRTQLSGLVAAGTVALVLLFLTAPLRFIPLAALGAVLVKAALSLVDISTLKQIYTLDRREFVLSLLATVGVVAVGSIRAILVAVILALLRFIKLVSRPKVEILGAVADLPGYHSIDRHPQAATVPGLTLLRFNAPLVFFNAPHFKRTVMALAESAGTALSWLVIDLLPVTLIDATGLYMMEEIAEALCERGIVLAAAGRQTEWRLWAESRHRAPETRKIPIYPNLETAVAEYRAKHSTGARAARGRLK
jgi:high affinity sulfate transporter 1